MRLLEGLSETLRFSIFSSLFLLSLYFLSYNFFYHKVYSLFLSLHPKNKTLAHLPLSVGNHPRVVLHHCNSNKNRANTFFLMICLYKNISSLYSGKKNNIMPAIHVIENFCNACNSQVEAKQANKCNAHGTHASAQAFVKIKH